MAGRKKKSYRIQKHKMKSIEKEVEGMRETFGVPFFILCLLFPPIFLFSLIIKFWFTIIRKKGD